MRTTEDHDVLTSSRKGWTSSAVMPFKEEPDAETLALSLSQTEEERDLANEKFEQEERMHQKTCTKLSELEKKVKEVRFAIFIPGALTCVLLFGGEELGLSDGRCEQDRMLQKAKFKLKR